MNFTLFVALVALGVASFNYYRLKKLRSADLDIYRYDMSNGSDVPTYKIEAPLFSIPVSIIEIGVMFVDYSLITHQKPEINYFPFSSEEQKGFGLPIMSGPNIYIDISLDSINSILDDNNFVEDELQAYFVYLRTHDGQIYPKFGEDYGWKNYFRYNSGRPNSGIYRPWGPN